MILLFYRIKSINQSMYCVTIFKLKIKKKNIRVSKIASVTPKCGKAGTLAVCRSHLVNIGYSRQFYIYSFHLYSFQDMLCIIAFGPSAARGAAANLLFHYWPTLRPCNVDDDEFTYTCKFEHNGVSE